MQNRLESPLTSSTAVGARISLLSIGVATAFAMSSGSTFAADSKVEEQIERIIVTGSRRNDRTVSQSNTPIDIINVEDMATTGQLEVSQILTTLIPSFNYPNAALADGTDHSRPAVLRGLAPDHTLVLINGKRRHSSALLNLNGTVGRGSTAVDLNTIPTSAIKSIEVLRDGASAQYGSDAIAGVINIILKDQEGGSISATYGQYETQMAGVAQLESVGVDGNGDLAFTTGDDRNRSDGGTTTLAADWGTSLGDNGFLNLAVESRKRNATLRSGFDPREQYARDSNDALDPREFSIDRYNHKFGRAEVDDFSVFYNLGYELTPTTELYSFGSYAKRDGLSAGFYRRPQDSRNIIDVYPDGFLPHIGSDVTDKSVVIGVKGEDNDWTWDVSGSYGKNNFDFSVLNSLNTSLGAESPTSFDNGGLVYDQTILNFSASTFMDWNLTNEVFVAFGGEYRSENYQVVAGEEASYITKLDSAGLPIAAGGAQVLSGFSPDSAVDESRHNSAVWVELDTDLNDDFNVTFASRFENYSDFGSAFNHKLSLRYAASDNLALRGGISSGFRAPSLAQTSYKSISTVFSDGIPSEVGIFPVADPAAVALGATELTAEESVNSTIGFAYELDDFNLTVDAYYITIDDRIVLSENLSGTEVEAILVSAGELNTTRARYFTNAIDTTTKGIDVVATYDQSLDNYGDLRFSLAINVNDTKVSNVKANPAELDALGDDYILFSEREIARFETSTPKNKINFSTTWTNNDIAVTLRTTRYGEVVDPSTDTDLNEVLDAKWITDLDVGYQLTADIKLSVGANNLFDQYPQDTVSNVRQSTFNQIFPYSAFSAYGTDGRFVYGRATYTF